MRHDPDYLSLAESGRGWQPRKLPRELLVNSVFAGCAAGLKRRIIERVEP